MNFRLICNNIGRILRLEGLLMVPAIICAICFNEDKAAISFAISAVASICIGFLLTFIKPKEESFYAREGFITVALTWIVLSLFGALPFVLSGAIPNFIDAFFETVSGFTTTGMSVLKDVEVLPKSILYWRSFTHWLGGMGVLAFMIAFSPMKKSQNVGSFKMIKAESPGPVVGRLVPKIQDTARILYAIYVLLTVLEFILLLCGGMPLFDSIVNSFATAGTGGFAVLNASMAGYSSTYLQTVIAIFMIIFGINFNVFYLLILRDFKSVFKNSELKLYIGTVIVATAVITVNTLSVFPTAFEALHHSFFQVASIITTTGFTTVDFNSWPMLSKMVLFSLMFVGASAGSTGGGFKISRVLILGKSLKISLQKLIHPKSVKSVSIDGKTVDDGVVKEVYGYFTAYIAIIVVSVLVFSFENFSFETTFTSVISCLNNVGPIFGNVGGVLDFDLISPIGKIILCLDMLIGRLEIFPVLLLFYPSTWKRSA